MKKIIAIFLALTLTFILIPAVPASADIVYVDNFPVPGRWYQYELSDKTPKKIGIQPTKTGNFTVQIRTTSLDLVKGDITVRYEHNNDARTWTYTPEQVYDNSREAFAEVAKTAKKKYKFTDEQWQYIDEYYKLFDPNFAFYYKPLTQKPWDWPTIEKFQKAVKKKITTKADISMKGYPGNYVFYFNSTNKGDKVWIRVLYDYNFINEDYRGFGYGGISVNRGATLDISVPKGVYGSTDNSVVCVDKKGIAHALNTGRCVITATNKDGKVTAKTIHVCYDGMTEATFAWPGDDPLNYGKFYDCGVIRINKGETLQFFMQDFYGWSQINSEDTSIVFPYSSSMTIKGKKKGYAYVTVRGGHNTCRYLVVVK